MIPHLCLVNSMRSWGGAELWFLDTAVQLQARGHRVSLVCQPDSELSRRGRAAGVQVAQIPIRFDAAPWTLWRLGRYFRQTGVTALLTNLTKDLKAAGVAGRLAGIGCIWAARESDFPLKSSPHYRGYFGRVASGLLVASEATRRTTCDSAPWLPPDRIQLVYKGIDVQRFSPAAEVSAHRPPTVGFVGQLIERKGLPQLMQAWSRLEKRDWPQRPHLKIAGQGILDQELKHWRTRLDHPQAVHILGFVEDPLPFFQQLDILAMPSFAEGFGLSAAEAGACGVPVVAGRASSLPEIVLDEETGLLVDPGDHLGLENALAKLLDNPDRARSLGQAARRHVTRHFDREHTLDQLEALCQLEIKTEVRP
jgi:glycosyltransferase involved in cell wall biosynthesis|nr:glycosyltransferase family 4 protein [Candidatus Krumholzibacteria bacterium]